MSDSAPERDAQLLAIGHQCSEQSCLLVDFLPFKCQHCSQRFCGEHFTVAAHKCPSYDESKHNRVAPSCPLCNSPVAIPPGQDPNIRMERHISTECSVMTGKSGKTRSAPVCARGKCGKVLFAPIGCDKCKQQFCPQHRFPKDHSCPSLSTPATSSSGASRAPPSSLLARSMPKFSVKSSGPSTGPAKKASGSTAAPAPSRAAQTPNSSQLNGINIFSKTDR
ncbi:hypothetical protein BV22DRAFT_1016291 [Leucogyrophana mollusca]|uniref:Uncharacterized protein n=1 Tax=Leucogyrophana mollusca TaxID=85980 RepID=A0ACB8BBW6_9AGAM|nr:hypothetical protein BV22DRAFT_1016291 [Leucogyrophana mollusca]